MAGSGSRLKIGVFDSGIGGVTVLLELLQTIPGADYVYLGDTANLPYGTKSPQQIQKLCGEGARTLKAKNIDFLVVACNTAAGIGLDVIRKEMGATPVIEVIEPGVRSAVEAMEAMTRQAGGDVPVPLLVLATKATVNNHAYGRTARRVLGDQYPIFEQACPVLVPMIEEGWIDHPALHLAVEAYVRPHFESLAPGVVVLGCTHYPWIQAPIQKALPGWSVVNSARTVALALKKEAISLGRDGLDEGEPNVEWIFTDPDAVPEFAHKIRLRSRYRFRSR